MTKNNYHQLSFSSVLILLALMLSACNDAPDTKPAETLTPVEATPVDPTPIDAAPVESTLDETMAAEPEEVEQRDPNWKQSLSKPELMSFAAGDQYFWVLDTNIGRIKVRLMPDVAPMHVTSTIYLTELGFYDDTVFHRVIPGFMAQGGDPTGTGRGGPGYKYDGEYSDTVSHDKPGMLSMANAGQGTDGSQFFLTFVPTPFLDGKHTADMVAQENDTRMLGRLLRETCRRPTDCRGTEQNRQSPFVH